MARKIKRSYLIDDAGAWLIKPIYSYRSILAAWSNSYDNSHNLYVFDGKELAYVFDITPLCPLILEILHLKVPIYITDKRLMLPYLKSQITWLNKKDAARLDEMFVKWLEEQINAYDVSSTHKEQKAERAGPPA